MVCQQGREELNEGHNIILEKIKEDYQGKQGITENEPEVHVQEQFDTGIQEREGDTEKV